MGRLPSRTVREIKQRAGATSLRAITDARAGVGVQGSNCRGNTSHGAKLPVAPHDLVAFPESPPGPSSLSASALKPGRAARTLPPPSGPRKRESTPRTKTAQPKQRQRVREPRRGSMRRNRCAGCTRPMLQWALGSASEFVFRETGFNAISPAHRAVAERAGSRDAMTKIIDVHIDRLMPCRASRTSLRRSHRSRKQNQPGLRRLRSERYPYR